MHRFTCLLLVCAGVCYPPVAVAEIPPLGCPPNQTVVGDSCAHCSSGSYTLDSGSCLLCPRGADCPALSSLPGFWIARLYCPESACSTTGCEGSSAECAQCDADQCQEEPCSTRVCRLRAVSYECYPSSACTGDSECREGHVGQKCDACAEGWSVNFSNLCQEGFNRGATIAGIVLGSAAGVLLIGGGIHFFGAPLSPYASPYHPTPRNAMSGTEIAYFAGRRAARAQFKAHEAELEAAHGGGALPATVPVESTQAGT